MMGQRWSRGKAISTKRTVVFLERRDEFKPTLEEFWNRAARVLGIVERLMLLQEFAERLVYREQTYSQIRKGSAGIKKPRGMCWGCRSRPAEARHHIVQVQHGGRNVLKNIVCVCRGCHAVVHPWMRKKGGVMGS
jgi:hypothetical protein